MHELSIAHSLVDLAVDAVEREGRPRVVEVRIVVGALAGVSIDSLLFCYDIAARGTLLEGSRLVVRHVPLVIHCPVCRVDVELPGSTRFRCPVCDTPSGDIRQGRELHVEGLEVENLEVEDLAAEGLAAEPGAVETVAALPKGGDLIS